MQNSMPYLMNAGANVKKNRHYDCFDSTSNFKKFLKQWWIHEIKFHTSWSWNMFAFEQLFKGRGKKRFLHRIVIGDKIWVDWKLHAQYIVVIFLC